MESSRLHRLLLSLTLGLAVILPAAAQESTATETVGTGVRQSEPAEAVTPKERPRLKDNQVVSLKRRLEVHGGMSFTYGWASGGRNFREAGAWVSYFDPQSGLGLAFGLSRFSGDAPYSYGYYPYYPYASGYGYNRLGGLYGTPGTGYDVELFWVRPSFSLSVGFSQNEFPRPTAFDGSGYALRGPAGRRF